MLVWAQLIGSARAQEPLGSRRMGNGALEVAALLMSVPTGRVQGVATHMDHPRVSFDVPRGALRPWTLAGGLSFRITYYPAEWLSVGLGGEFAYASLDAQDVAPGIALPRVPADVGWIGTTAHIGLYHRIDFVAFRWDLHLGVGGASVCFRSCQDEFSDGPSVTTWFLRAEPRLALDFNVFGGIWVGVAAGVNLPTPEFWMGTAHFRWETRDPPPRR